MGLFHGHERNRCPSKGCLLPIWLNNHVSVDEKLAWLFKLYDKDSNGEIVQEEMEDIFLKLCRIVEKTEVDHFKKHAKLAEEERKKKVTKYIYVLEINLTFQGFAIGETT